MLDDMRSGVHTRHVFVGLQGNTQLTPNHVGLRKAEIDVKREPVKACPLSSFGWSDLVG